MDRVCFGIPYYGTQTAEWWNPLVSEAARLYADGIELEHVISIGGMMTDSARNHIVKEFLETKADWLQWIDADNTPPLGMVRRLLNTGKTVVTGVYVKRGANPEPLLFHRTPTGMYQVMEHWRVGEILPIDAAGLGGTLVHRSVFEAIERDYRALEKVNGGLTIVHKDDIWGDVFDSTAETDGKVVEGVYHERLRQPMHKHVFPYFMTEYCRTEDYGFFERCARVGHPLWVDTSVELGHVGTHVNKPKDWREKQKGKQ